MDGTDLEQTICIAIENTVFQSRMRQQLEQYPKFASAGNGFVKDSIALVAAIKTIPEDGGRSIIVQAYMKSLHTIWMDMCIVSGIGLLLGAFIQHYTLDVPLSTDEKSNYEESVDDA